MLPFIYNLFTMIIKYLLVKGQHGLQLENTDIIEFNQDIFT